MLISIVIPVYGVEKYLDKCVESVIKQTYHNIEVILVDDGSPDACPEMCDRWAKKDPRIKVIHQRNMGLGPARNTGIDAAQGEYIGFVDSDDWIQPEMYQRLVEEAQKSTADIVIGGHRDVAGLVTMAVHPHPLSSQCLSSEKEIDACRKRLFGHAPWERETEAFPVMVWSSLYRRELLVSKGIRFQDILSEDTIFNLEAYRFAERITVTEGTDYCYRKENQISITQTFSPTKRYRFIQFLSVLAQIAEREADEECILRTKRTAIDYCRAYVALVAKSDLSISEKKKEIHSFARSTKIFSIWNGYPTKTLPIKQKIFHWAIVHGRYTIALLLICLRNQQRSIAHRRELCG